jgi:hypothetical protein
MVLRRRNPSNAATVKNHNGAGVNSDRSNLLDTICWVQLEPSQVISKIRIRWGLGLGDRSEKSDGDCAPGTVATNKCLNSPQPSSAGLWFRKVPQRTSCASG